jgi:hypothetical protein
LLEGLMRKLLAASVTALLLLGLAVAAPAAAKTRMDVTMTVATYFDTDPSQFTASIPGCTEGDTYTSGGAAFPPVFGVFVGYKAFDCGGGGETGFLVHLSAQFSYSGGSVGTWSIVDAWGDLAGMSGGGKLLGVAIPDANGITDYYFGTITL